MNRIPRVINLTQQEFNKKYTTNLDIKKSLSSIESVFAGLFGTPLVVSTDLNNVYNQLANTDEEYVVFKITDDTTIKSIAIKLSDIDNK